MTDKEPVVFVVDGDAACRERLVKTIREQGMDVEAYDSAESFLKAIDRSRLGCLVTELQLPGISGLALQEKLQADGIDLPVIVVTADADVPTAVRAIKTGAVTVLEKPCANEELWGNIAAAIERHRRARDAQRRRTEVKARLRRLTPEERQILDRILAGKPNKLIATELAIGLRTVELRRANIFKKMEAHSLAELVRLHLDARQQDSQAD